MTPTLTIPVAGAPALVVPLLTGRIIKHATRSYGAEGVWRRHTLDPTSRGLMIFGQGPAAGGGGASLNVGGGASGRGAMGMFLFGWDEPIEGAYFDVLCPVGGLPGASGYMDGQTYVPATGGFLANPTIIRFPTFMQEEYTAADLAILGLNPVREPLDIIFGSSEAGGPANLVVEGEGGEAGNIASNTVDQYQPNGPYAFTAKWIKGWARHQFNLGGAIGNNGKGTMGGKAPGRGDAGGGARGASVGGQPEAGQGGFVLAIELP